MVDTEVIIKVCSKCGEEKALQDYYKDKNKPFGVRSDCKRCCSARLKHTKTTKKEYDKRYREANKDRLKLVNKRYYESNKERVKKQQGDYYKKNIESRRCYSRRYSKNNRHIQNAKDSRRRALEVSSIPEHLRGCKEEKDRLKNIYFLSSTLSKCTGDVYHVDHMWPLSDGGPHWSGNLQIITAEDNLRKNATVCEDIKKTVKEALEWEIQRYNNERLDTRDS